MLPKINLTKDIFWVGVNDRRTERFENYWPLPFGVSYNSYVIVDEKIALIDTVEAGFIDSFLDNIKAIIGEKSPDYLIVNHAEPDHSGSIRAILREYPNITLIGNAKTFPMIEGFYGNCENKIVIEEGETLPLGRHTLQFFTVPMVHWPESMVTYETSEKILFSNDSFGSFGSLDGGIFDDEVNLLFFETEMRRYYSNIVGKYGVQVQKALGKLGGLEICQIAPSHGPIWRSNIGYVLDKYDQWSKCDTEEGVIIVYGSLYGNTAKMADIIARSIAEEGIKNIRVFDASKTHSSFIISELWRYRGVVFGSSAYNGGIFTPMRALIRELEHIMPKNHLLGIFGSMSWSGGGVRTLEDFSNTIKWDLVAPSVEVKHAVNEEDIVRLRALGKAMANAVKNK